MVLFHNNNDNDDALFNKEIVMVLFHVSFSESWNAETKSGRHLQRELWTRVSGGFCVFVLYCICVRPLVIVSLLVFATIFLCICIF